MELIGHEFAVALREGLSRVAPRWTAGSPTADPAPMRPPPYAALLRDHREEILDDLAEEILATPGSAFGRRSVAPLIDWARAMLMAVDTRYVLGVDAARLPRNRRGLVPPAPHRELAAATLLMECASRRLPDIPERVQALQALGRTLRASADAVHARDLAG